MCRSRNGSSRGKIRRQEGKWGTAGKGATNLGFVCEKPTGDFCAFDMVDYGSYCLDFRLDARYDMHDWAGARADCENYGMKMLQISAQHKDEFINDYLVDTDLFTTESGLLGVWLGASGEIKS